MSIASIAAKMRKQFELPTDLEMGVTQWLSTGFAPLDLAISGKSEGGGMPVGRIVEMFGPSSCGKTAIATNVMAGAQKMGGLAMFMDHERSFDKRLAEQLGLDADGNFLYERPDTYEQSLTYVVNTIREVRESKAIPDEAPIVVVLDSLAAMVPQSKMEKDISAQGMNDSLALAKATSATFPAMAVHCEKFNMLLLVLNQMRLKPGVVYGPPETTPGGEAPRYYASVRIQLGAQKQTEGEGKDKQMIGQDITAICIKNKVSRPFQKAIWEFRFREDGSGFFDVTTSLIRYGIKEEILAYSKPRVTWTDGKQYFVKALAEKIDKEGLQEELRKLVMAPITPSSVRAALLLKAAEFA